MDLKLLNRTHAKILTDIVRDVIIFHCCSVRLLSAQNQRVAYKLASQEYLGCTRDQPMPGPFPAPPIFKGKSPGDEVVGPSVTRILITGVKITLVTLVT